MTLTITYGSAWAGNILDDGWVEHLKVQSVEEARSLFDRRRLAFTED